MSFTDQIQNHRLLWLGRDVWKPSTSMTPQWAGTSSTRLGCSDPHLIQPWMFQGIGHLQRKHTLSLLPCAHQAPYNEQQWLLLEDIWYPYDGTRYTSQYGGPCFWFIVVSESESEERKEKQVRRNQNGFMGSRWKSLSCSPSLLGYLEKQVLPPPSFTFPCTSLNYSVLLTDTDGKGNDKKIQRLLKKWGGLFLGTTSAARKCVQPYPKSSKSQAACRISKIHLSSEKGEQHQLWAGYHQLTQYTITQYNLVQIYSFLLHRLLCCGNLVPHNVTTYLD